MRLWSIHPRYLDTTGLVALWRETLLAQKVLQGDTRGYTRHPQLARFRETKDPVGAIAVYLVHVADEADRRGYNFNRNKIAKNRHTGKIQVTAGQASYELAHLSSKLKSRSPSLFIKIQGLEKIELHPLFEMIDGDVALWEKNRA